MTGETPPQPPPKRKPRWVRFLLVGLGIPWLVGLASWLWLRPPSQSLPGAGADPTAEARVNVLKLCGDVQSYRDEHGTYLVAGPTPHVVPQGYAMPWPADEKFHALGFEPGPYVRYQYEVVVQADPVGEPEVSCYARGDLDGDGQNSLFRVTLDVNGMSSPVHVERESE